MQNDAELHKMPADTKFFVYREVPLAYSPETGMCWRADSRNGNWSLVTPGTAKGAYTLLRIEGRNKALHRIIAEVFLNAGKPLTTQQQVDHREHADGSHGQDRLSNLRICSHRENSWNMRLFSTSTSGYKGVCWDKRANKWLARIRISGKQQWIGHFTSAEAAAKAYDKAAIRHFGEFALTNEKLGLLSCVENAAA